MRLLHTQTLQFKEFFDSNIPPYAILSHRWEETEPTFKTFKNSVDKKEQLFWKVNKCCELAHRCGRDWVWVDTICIDKRSSAELSEAINSMYCWYKNAQECYVYMSDVDFSHAFHTDVEGRSVFRDSKWFTRGWTLQELLAPTSVMFFDQQWSFIGTRNDLGSDIEAATGISRLHLSVHELACTAVKMSWASKRVTSRIEDTAYCLMGLFNVNMPLLYGEGEKAFLRLQLELIKQDDDDSIFAWDTSAYENDTFIHYMGMLAPGPMAFAAAGDIEPLDMYRRSERVSYSMTNRGLELHVPLSKQLAWATARDEEPECLFVLNRAMIKQQGEVQAIAICLKEARFGCWSRSFHWTRLYGEKPVRHAIPYVPLRSRTLYVSQQQVHSLFPRASYECRLRQRVIPSP